jgi:hypothetical protein
MSVVTIIEIRTIFPTITTTTTNSTRRTRISPENLTFIFDPISSFSDIDAQLPFEYLRVYPLGYFPEKVLVELVVVEEVSDWMGTIGGMVGRVLLYEDCDFGFVEVFCSHVER